MSDKVSGLPNRGATYYGEKTPPTTFGTDIGLEGQEQTFRDYDPAATSGGVRLYRSNRESINLLVRNVSGIALLPKRVVKWKAGFRNKRVDGYCAIDWEMCAGVVDEMLPAAGVQANDLFWLTVKGPTLIKTSLAADATAVITEGDLLVALTAATSQATTAGRVQAQVGTTNTTNILSMSINGFARAMSAKTTANTNNDVLADVYFMR